jgi:hypothetical protein
MADQNLFFPICVPLLLVLILVVAVLGMRARLRFASRLRHVHRDKVIFNNWLKVHQTRQRFLLAISLISVIGVFALGTLILSGILFLSKIILIVLLFLIILGFIAGTLILIDLKKLAK